MVVVYIHAHLRRTILTFRVSGCSVPAIADGWHTRWCELPNNFFAISRANRGLHSRVKAPPTRSSGTGSLPEIFNQHDLSLLEPGLIEHYGFAVAGSCEPKRDYVKSADVSNTTL